MRERAVRAVITRREAITTLLLGAASLPLVRCFGADAFAAPQDATTPGGAARRTTSPRARAVIEIWMSGGPSHVDTFDPKPEAGYDVCGPLSKPVETNVSGIRISELMPNLAQQADKFSLLRSMTHGINGHETATFATQTGRDPGERLVYPGLGAVVAAFRGYDRGYDKLIPPYVVLTQPLGRFSESGFLGPRCAPFVTGGDPNARRFAVDGIVSEGITDARQLARRGLLKSLDTLGRAVPADRALATHDEAEAKAYDLILGDAGKLFDLSQEKDDLRDRYGRTTFGQSCLMARRLVEHGVPYVTIHAGGWDMHKQIFETLRRRLPEIDRGIAALLADLSGRGLLDSTVVWACGEFGRTPRVQWEQPWNGGRGHHGACFSALVAGGGFRGGVVVGASDAKGEQVADRPVRVPELLGAICGQMGIDPDGPMPNPLGIDIPVMPALPAAAADAPAASPKTPVRRLPELVP